MSLRWFLARTGLFFLAFFAVLPVFAQQTTLPDAPKPSDPANNTPAAIQRRKWSDVIEPGEKIPPLSTKDKLLFPIHEELRPIGWFPTFLSAGWQQFRDSDPKYGRDSGAFGERLGAAALRDFSMRGFSDGLLPAVLHEDPRYFRKADGGWLDRGFYAASRVFVGQRDSGAKGLNTSILLGHGMASALTMAYYPDRSANGRVVAKTWGYSLAGEAGSNLWAEFWPDVRNKFFTRHKEDAQ